MKLCGACQTPKALDEFARDSRRPDGRQTQCRQCRKAYQELVKPRRRAANAVYRAAHHRENPTIMVASRLRSRIWRVFKTAKGERVGSAVRDLGCSVAELRAHIEAGFYPHPETGEAMSWGNYGLHGWHVDHKTPLDAFDLTDRAQFLQACHFTNLQPLWAEHNLEKRAREDWVLKIASPNSITNPSSP